MSQVDITIEAHYDSTSNHILFGSESTHVTSVDEGRRAEIKVPNLGQKETTITLQLSGGDATFPEAGAAVKWTHPSEQPSWARVDRVSDFEVKVIDTHQIGQEPKDASFIIRVLADGSIFKSEDPTIIHNPTNR